MEVAFQAILVYKTFIRCHRWRYGGHLETPLPVQEISLKPWMLVMMSVFFSIIIKGIFSVILMRIIQPVWELHTSQVDSSLVSACGQQSTTTTNPCTGCSCATYIAKKAIKWLNIVLYMLWMQVLSGVFRQSIRSIRHLSRNWRPILIGSKLCSKWAKVCNVYTLWSNLTLLLFSVLLSCSSYLLQWSP